MRDLRIKLLIDRSQSITAARAESQQIRRMIADYDNLARARSRAYAPGGMPPGRSAGQQIAGAPGAGGRARAGGMDEAARQLVRQQAIEDGLAAKDYRSRVRAEARKQALAERSGAQLAAIEEKYAAQDYRATTRRLAREEAAQRRADTAKRARADRTAAQLAAVEDRFAARDYRATVRNLARQEQAEARAFARKRARMDDLTLSAASAISAYAGFAGISTLLSDIAAGFQAQADAQRELSDEAIRQRDALREIAAMKDVEAGTESGLKMGAFMARTGMRLEEAVGFQSAFYGSGAQFEERTGKQEFEDYMGQVGLMAGTTGIDATVLGDLAGTILGSRDFGQYGDKASEQALAEFNAAFKVLQRGRGQNASIAEGLSRAAAGMVSEGETASVFENTVEAAMAISAIAESRPDEAEVFTRAGIRGLYATSGPEAELLKEAGVKTTADETGDADKFFTRVEKIAPVLQAEAQASGRTLTEVVKKHYSDEREQVAISALIERGVVQGVFEDRRRYAREVGGYDQEQFRATGLMEEGRAERAMAEALSRPDSAIAARIAGMQGQQVLTAKGFETSEARTLEKEAEARLKVADMSMAGKDVALFGAAQLISQGFGVFGGTDVKGARTTQTALSLIDERAAMWGMEEYDPYAAWERLKGEGGPPQKSAILPFLQEEIETLQEAGINPLIDPRTIAQAEAGRTGLSDPEVKQILKDIRDRLPNGPPGGPRNNPAPAPRAAKPAGAAAHP